jgi:hypothetical protein
LPDARSRGRIQQKRGSRPQAVARLLPHLPVVFRLPLSRLERVVVRLVFQPSVQPTARRCLPMFALSVLSDAPRQPAARR